MREVTEDRADRWLAVAVGATIALVLGGYQFGRSNHAVYLLDALHRSDPQVLANDWFTTATLQYHALFGLLARGLWDAGIIRPAFLVGYVALVVLLHVAWLGIVRSIGGTARTYLVSVLLVYASANATGLGMYQFLQDSAFLPSNVAAVALLWAVYAYAGGRFVIAGAATGLAAAFHLNYAIVGAGLWVALTAWRLWTDGVAAGFSPLVRGDDRISSGGDRSQYTASGLKPAATPVWSRPYLLGTVLALVPAVASVALAWLAIPRDRPRMPLGEFVDLYVRLRHPHHYDPSSWPAALWVAFLWPVPLAARAYVKRVGTVATRDDVIAQLARVYLLLAAVVLIALLLAGAWYVSETLVQLSLFRFTPFLQLLACVAVAWLVCDARAFGRLSSFLAPAVALVMLAAALVVAGNGDVLNASLAMRPLPLAMAGITALVGWSLLVVRLPVWVRTTTVAALVGVTAVAWPHLGVVRLPGDVAYADVEAWARDNTPAGAVFLVPPDEETFRLSARRAVVVNFKGVPQLSTELPQWRDRMRDVLAMPDLRVLPRPFYRTLADIRARYDALPPSHMIATADKYDATYILVTKELENPRLRLAYASSPPGYFLYHLLPAQPG